MTHATATQAVQRSSLMFELRKYIPRSELSVIASACRGEEGAWFQAKLAEIAETIRTMPRTYGQDGKGGAAVAFLHYFTAGSDWYITELDSETEQHQAFGLADIFGDGGEVGYISIIELVSNGAELDLHWTPKTLDECRKR